ncbi:ABC transporter permease [Limosilactobacillus fermentum]|uniref:ABC transporter permease n=1 Tax=Limosilactobacillus fermentum TaxID=1613 RepID=UPI0019653AA8|nr:ABC transporter permease [Limosilactobacillus fermentum]MBM9561419.1 ABC transporter permease [Limosilactobacillus fermentum]
MFKLELRKSVRNRTLLYIVSIVMLSYILGYILPVGIDKVSSLGLGDFYFSTYTVFTQFGFLIFGFVVVYFFNKDYSEKTILWNYFSGYQLVQYFYSKLSVLFIEFVISIFLANIIVCFIFGFSIFYFLFSTIAFSIIVLQYLLIVGTISVIFSNMLISIGISLAYWIISIILVAVGGIFKYVAIFDASNSLYTKVTDIMVKGNIQDFSPFYVILPYIIVLFIINYVYIKNFTRRWLKNGV